jgi:hypothetical protein
MVNQSEIGACQGAPFGLRIYPQIWKWEDSCLSPEFDGGFNLRRPEEIGRLGGLRRFGHHSGGTVHIIAADLVFCTVATDSC